MPTDIVDALEIARRADRDKSTIVGYWMKDPDFPKPWLKLGRSNGYYWPDVQMFLKRKGIL